MSTADIANSSDWLSDEGHIYSTIDDDHFKTTSIRIALIKLFEFRMSSTKPHEHSAMLKSMLFKKKYSDLIFEWEDGSRVNAHQMVVFGRSEYFE